MQLTIQNFPKYKPNITLDRVLLLETCFVPGNKEIRLAVDLAKQAWPMDLDRCDAVRSILQCDISNERINAVKPFRKIIHKRVIEFKDGKHKTVKIIRKRRK